jgi:hypothetical protein
MSDTPDSPSSSSATTIEKPVAEKPAEPPFNTDVLQSCTARFTHKAWYLYHNHRQDIPFLRQTPIRATLTARTPEGAQELQDLLVAEGVREISRIDAVLSLTATFEILQKVIRHPQALLLDAIPL